MSDNPADPSAETQDVPPDNMTSKDYYADSYAHFGIHEEMLKDTVRTTSYRNAMYNNSHLFKGKTVLDVGCGTGILSMFAAKAGARHVVGIDMSNIIDQAQKIIEANGFKDTITLVKGKLEEAVLPFQQFDIIFSLYTPTRCLTLVPSFRLYESMLDTVLLARDRYLAPDGLLFPDTATIYLAAIEDQDYKEEKINFWDNVYGFDYSCIKDIALREPLVDTVEVKAVVTSPCAIKHINLRTAKKEDLTFSADFKLTAERTDFIHAFLAWFDIVFDSAHKPVKFSTGPHAKYTHWKQTVFYTKDAGEEIVGNLSCAPNQRNNRDLDILIKYETTGERPVSDSIQYKMCVLIVLIAAQTWNRQSACCEDRCLLSLEIIPPVISSLSRVEDRNGDENLARGQKRFLGLPLPVYAQARMPVPGASDVVYSSAGQIYSDISPPTPTPHSTPASYIATSSKHESHTRQTLVPSPT
ncbi:hypothetical protein FRC10_010066 [Ceratobasidium sp. 414]|nr:hypothetical protein FRC10_010066 [Ceratobasidium sp. 414]